MFCSICHENIKKSGLTTTMCKHRFHRSCLKKWLIIKNECPNCKKEYPVYLDPPPIPTLQDFIE